MQTNIAQHHKTDENGNPAGGSTYGNGFAISWQNGPLVKDGDRIGPNGAFVENVIVAAIGRLEYYQDSKFACEENHQALYFLYKALAQLEARTARRQAEGVEGTHES